MSAIRKPTDTTDDQTPRLRIWAPPLEADPPQPPRDDGSQPPTPQPTGPTLSEFYEASIRPELLNEGRSAETLAEHRRSLRRWEHWLSTGRSAAERGDRTRRPVLISQIDAPMLAEFRDYLKANKIPDYRGKPTKLGTRAINKTVGYLQMMLGWGVETGDVRAAPRVRRIPQTAQTAKLEIPDDHVNAIFRACGVATWPVVMGDGRKVRSAPDVWRFLVVWWLNYGIRTEDLAPYSLDVSPITWDLISDDPENPHHNGHCVCPHGWFFYCPHKTRRKKTDFLTLPINETCRFWLERLALAVGGKPDGRPLVDLPRSKDAVYAQWRAILAAAGVAPKPLLRINEDGTPERIKRRYIPWHLRCTAATRIEDHASATLGHAGIGQLVTGHAPNRDVAARIQTDVFRNSYYTAEAAILKTLETIPQPEAFRETA